MILLVDFKHYYLNIYKTHKVAHLCYFYNACLLFFITNDFSVLFIQLLNRVLEKLDVSYLLGL